ncbi:MAG: CbtA family protein [Aeromicrobium sp.]
MTPRSFLVRGLLAGVVAGLFTFSVAYVVGEPQIDVAIAVEEAGSAAAPAAAHSHDESMAPHHHEEGGTVISRDTQSTWGLLTATLGLSVALGGTVALVSAFALGRFGRLRPELSTALVAGVGFVSVAVVPFLKYPPNPPSVGDPDTLGARTVEYFAFMVISIGIAVAATVLARRLSVGHAYRGIIVGILAYLMAMTVIGNLMPTVNEIGSFPADTLWYYRRASIMTLATMWLVAGLVLSALVHRLHAQQTAVRSRRELAALI